MWVLSPLRPHQTLNHCVAKELTGDCLLSSPLIPQKNIPLWSRYPGSSAAATGVWRPPGNRNFLPYSPAPGGPIRESWSKHRGWSPRHVHWLLQKHLSPWGETQEWLSMTHWKPRESEGCCGFSSSYAKVRWSWDWALPWCLSCQSDVPVPNLFTCLHCLSFSSLRARMTPQWTHIWIIPGQEGGN